MNKFEYFEPQSVDDLLSLLEEYGEGAKILAGGTDLIPQMKRGLIVPRVLLSLSKISDLQKVEEDQGGLRIGAMIALAILERSPLLASLYPGLQKAISHVGTPSIRNTATLGGNVCLDTKCIYRDQVQTWRRALEPCFKQGGQRCYVVRGGKTCHASLAADTVPVLIALGAAVEVLSASAEKSVPVEALYTGDGVRPLILDHKDLVTGVILPPLPGSTRCAYFRFSPRKAIDFPVVSAAIYLDAQDGICLNVRAVLGAVAPKPIRLSQLEEALKGKRITQDLLRECSEEAPAEALQKSKSGRIDVFTRKMITHLVYQGLTEVSERK